MEEELNTVYCQVDFALNNGNRALFNQSNLNESLTKEVIIYLKSLGVDCKIEPPFQGGGGGFDGISIGELRYAWEHRQILTLISYIFYTVKFFSHRWLTKRVFEDKPRLNIFLKIKAHKSPNQYEEETLNSIIRERLINLKNLSDGVCAILSTKYPFFLFDQMIRASVYHKSFRVNYLLPHEQQNMVNNFRIIKLFKTVKVKENSESYYEFTNWFAISREDRRIEANPNGSIMGDAKSTKYFLIFSSQLLRDYFIR